MWPFRALFFMLCYSCQLLALEVFVKADQNNEVTQDILEDNDSKRKVVKPPPSFVAVVPTSIMGDFDNSLFPFVIEEETTTTTTTTTPAPFGKNFSNRLLFG